jgi:hypothetical protein
VYARVGSSVASGAVVATSVVAFARFDARERAAEGMTRARSCGAGRHPVILFFAFIRATRDGRFGSTFVLGATRSNATRARIADG